MTPGLKGKRVLRRLRMLYLLGIGLLGVILTFGERFEALHRSKAWVYTYVLVDAFKLEALSLLAVLLAWEFAARPSQALTTRRTGRLTAVVVLVVALLGLIAYEGRMYVAGKQIYLREYPERLVLRAEAAFLQGDLWLAEVHLHVCSAVFRSSRCGEVLEQLNTRLERARRIREFYEALPKGTPPPIFLLETGYLLDRNLGFYEQVARSLEATEGRLKREYIEAIREISAGDLRNAAKRLGAINREWRGFGDSHLLLRDVERMRGRTDVDPERVPYVAGVHKYGPDSFIQQTVKVDRLPPNSQLKRAAPPGVGTELQSSLSG